jgi:hypothetical protein
LPAQPLGFGRRHASHTSLPPARSFIGRLRGLLSRLCRLHVLVEAFLAAGVDFRVLFLSRALVRLALTLALLIALFVASPSASLYLPPLHYMEPAT